MAQPTETSRLRLLPLTLDRLQDAHLMWSDPQAMFWSLSGPTSSLELSEARLRKTLSGTDPPDRLDWLVYLRGTGTTDEPKPCIGMVAMWKRRPEEPGLVAPGHTWVISYMLLEAFWGKGYAAEMSEGMIQGAQEQIRPCTLQAYINPAHPASGKVAKKLGFELEEQIYRPEMPKLWIGGAWREYDVGRWTRKCV